MRWTIAPFLLLFLAGCARVSVNTQVAADGSFSRTVKYAVKKQGDGLSQSGPKEAADAFVIPSGAGITVTKSTTDDEVVTEVQRKLSPGAAPLQDITLLSEKKEPLLKSTVSVTKLADGGIEYVERLHWVGAPLKGDFDMPAQYRDIIKKALPERGQKTEIIDGVRQDLAVATIRAFFGPSEPIFFDLLTNTDVAERRLIGKIFPQLVSSLKDRVPDVSDDEAFAIAKKILGQLKLSEIAKTKANSAQPNADPNAKKSDGSEMTPITVAVGFPGKIVESNGITDPLTGEVYWSLYPPAAQVSDVELRVVAKP